MRILLLLLDRTLGQKINELEEQVCSELASMAEEVACNSV